MALGVVSLTCNAQIERVVLTPAKTVKPCEVTIDSVSKLLPTPVARTLTSVTVPERSAWNINLIPSDQNLDVLQYYVHLKGKDGSKQTMVYDKDGKLLQVKQVIKNSNVPEQIKGIVNTKFKDWNLVENEVRYYTTNNKAKTDYKVILKKGILKKVVLIDPNGEIKVALPTV